MCDGRRRRRLASVLFDLGTGCRRLGQAILEQWFPGELLSPGAPPRDVGTPRAPVVARSEARLSLNAFVTHLHFDHVQGLPFFAPALQPDVRLNIYGPEQEGSLSDAFEAFLQPPYFPVAVSELPAELNFRELEDRGVVQAGTATVLAARFRTWAARSATASRWQG